MRMTSEEFWNMTPKELALAVKGWREEQKRQAKEISNQVAKIFCGSKA